MMRQSLLVLAFVAVAAVSALDKDTESELKTLCSQAGLLASVLGSTPKVATAVELASLYKRYLEQLRGNEDLYKLMLDASSSFDKESAAAASDQEKLAKICDTNKTKLCTMHSMIATFAKLHGGRVSAPTDGHWGDGRAIRRALPT